MAGKRYQAWLDPVSMDVRIRSITVKAPVKVGSISVVVKSAG
jgi:hypothetical protein